MSIRRTLFALVAAAALAAGATSDAATAGSSAVARGLDLFIHAPDRGAPGATLPVQVMALGFPSVVTLRALEGATIEAAWDPGSLGKTDPVPAPVRMATDSAGRAHLDVPMPEGGERELRLVLSVRVGGKERSQSIAVRRIRPQEVELLVPDRRVVPGGATSAWVVVRSAATGQPVPQAPVEISLIEGGIARHKALVTTDAAGTAMTRVPIPWTDEPAWSWELRARTSPARGGESGAAQVTLTPREETPGTPQMVVSWSEGEIRAGETAAFSVRIRDGAGQPVAGLPVRTWIGPKGTSPPEDRAEWEQVSTLTRTDAAGEVRGTATAPATVVQGVGTSLRLVVKASVDGSDLSQEATVAVDDPSSSATLSPEAGSIVPGVEQRMLLQVLDARMEPVAAPFTVEGDGLRATVMTDAFGEAEVTWAPPPGLGARRDVGPCAGGVAASVRVRPAAEVPQLAPRRGAFELCVPVSRDASALVRAEPLMVRMGDRPTVRVIDAGKWAGEGGRAAGPASPWSVVVRSHDAASAQSFWLDDGARGGGVELGDGAPGVWDLSAASPRMNGPARVSGGGVIVTPRVLPALGARIAGGRAAPKGSVDVDLELGDGKGRGLPGTVSAVMVDRFGGGSVSGILALDTRSRLCRQVGVEAERCDRFLEGDPALDPLRRAALGGRSEAAVAPARDPGGSAREALDAVLVDVLRALEGAVFEAAESPDELAGVRRREPGGGWQFEPALMTRISAAMREPPLTPGGDPFALGDLVAVDPQVTFDNVARRIARVKLFRILATVRAYRRERDPAEPLLRDPNEILQRLVRGGGLPASLLIDPWGGTIRFVKSSAPPFPFLTVARGFALQAPGPDGRIGTADDVRDPFERVLRSGTPYARAVSEDQLVDAKLDMVVSEETVATWSRLIEELTGSALGGVGTLGHGAGTGSGQGFGSGHGRLGGSHRAGRVSFGIPSGVAYWSPPRRTDANGRLRMTIPLGDAETTWTIAFVGVPDGAMPATTHADVPVALPLSARVDTGAAWVEGDEVEAQVAVRNRSAGPARVALSFEAGGVAALADSRQKTAVVDVAAGGAAVVRVRLRAARAGRAELSVKASAPGVASDAVVHAWDVRPAGERTEMTSAQWIEGPAGAGSGSTSIGGSAALSVPAAGKGLRPAGAPRVVLERGVEGALEAALEAMDPDRLASPGAMADAVDVGARMARWAAARRGEASPLAARAREIARRAVGRLMAYRQGGRAALPWAAEARARALGPADVIAELPKVDATCPPKALALDEALDALDAEPASAAGAAEACWDAFVTDTTAAAQRDGDRVRLARAVLALAERPHRAAAAAALADRLRQAVSLGASGGVALPPHQAGDRAARAIVYAALLRAAGLGKSAAAPARLSAWLAVQRDPRGGYGSASATRAAVRALLSQPDGPPGPTRVTIVAGSTRREVEVGSSARVVVPLDPAAVRVEVSAAGPGVAARLERPVLRLWSSPPDDAASPVHMAVAWPERPRAGKTGTLAVSLQHGLDRPVSIDARIPLPPGVSLARPVNGVSQIQGTLVVRADMAAARQPKRLEIPVRFALAGKLTAPEARARVAFQDLAHAVAPARPLRVE